MSVPKAFIKDVAIPISKDYHFDNSPFPYPLPNHFPWATRLRRAISFNIWKRRRARKKAARQKDRSFIGRNKSMKKFLHFLGSGNKKGVFMVTGYRGMGKTSFVNKVLSIYIEQIRAKKWLRWLPGMGSHVSVIHITIAQKQPREEDILRLMLIKVYEECKRHSLRYRVKNALIQVMKVSFLLLLLPQLYHLAGKYLLFPIAEVHEMMPFWLSAAINWLAVLQPVINVIWLLGQLPVLLLVLAAISLLFLKDSRAMLLLQDIFKRCYASTSSEKTIQHELGIQGWLPKLAAFSHKQVVAHPVASAKEIEMALINFLELVDSEFIFVFDELDKIESAPFQRAGAENADRMTVTYYEQIRERKQAIIDIIGGLKNFLTTANARFIFIAGREMFDATLADIADRQSSLGSMFSDVFYVESFLKENFENNNNKSSVSISIEAYLRHVLYNDISGENDGQPDLYALTRERMQTAGAEREEIDKVLICLQDFVIYLTYRSNGSPQKIIKTVHEFIRSIKTPHPRDMEVIYANINPGSDKYLYFNFNDQYRIGFINYLYRPFLIEYGRNFKHDSDSIVASTSYLFDHLLKFYNFAFSISHLEMIPEVLSANKTPLLRTHIKKIVEYLSNKHIRETEIGLFQYKFLSRTLNEITFLSKTFESESAAFNFTLDESHSIKMHVNNKINALRNVRQKQGGGQDQGDNQHFSINYLQTMLGDLHFFDQEYDDAVIAYAEAIKPMSHTGLEHISARDFLIIIKTKLKLGLSFEKIHSYDDAIPFYSDAVQTAKQFFHHQLTCPKRRPVTGNCSGYPEDAGAQARPEILYDILQVVNQCFIANVVIQEKLGLEGITIRNLNRVLNEYFCLSHSMASHYGDNTLIDANVILVVANLLYFKNNDRKWEHEQVANTRSMVKELRQSIRSGHLREVSNMPVGPEWRTLYLYSAGLRKIMLGCNIPIDETPSHSIVADLLGAFTFNKPSVWENRLLTKNSFKYIGIFLSNMGDALLSNLKAPERENAGGKKENVSMKFRLKEIFDPNALKTQVENIEQYYEIRKSNIGSNETENEFPKEAFLESLLTGEEEEYTIANVLRCYALSGHSFMKRGRKFSTSFQYRKILHVLRLVLGEESIDKDDPKFTEQCLFLIEHTIKRPIVLIASQNNGHTDRHMINKYKAILPKDPGPGFEPRTDKYIEKYISFHPEIKEAEVLFNYIKIQIGCGDEAMCHQLVNHYNSIGTQYTRILELDLFVKLYQAKIKEADIALNNNAISAGNCMEIYREYLYCMLTILRAMDLYETDYMLGYSYQAYTHFRIAQFLVDHKGMVLYDPLLKGAIQQITELSEFRGSKTIDDPLYHFSMAKKYYVKTLQLHTEGTEYRSTMDDMIYLEDDINDNAYHFGAAMERYLLGNQTIRKYIGICNQYLKRPDL